MRLFQILQSTMVIGNTLGFTNQLSSRHPRKRQHLSVIRNPLDGSQCVETTKGLEVMQKDDVRLSKKEEIIWNQNETSSKSINIDVGEKLPSREEKFGFFANLPVEANQQLTIDQEIIGSILREPKVEVFDTLLVLLSSSLVALSTLNSIDLTTLANIIRAENGIALLFAAEFFIRWYSNFRWKAIPQYLTQPLVMVDVLVVILPLIPMLVPSSAGVYSFFPSWLFSASGLINLRLLRVLRLQRVLTDIDTFTDFQMALGIPRSEVKPYKLQLARVILSVFTLFSISSGLIYSTEHTVNPDIPDYFTAMYFGLITLTTVGFGDITPVTPEGKLVVSGAILAGVAVIPTQTASLVEALLERDAMRENERTGSTTNTPANLPPSENRGGATLAGDKCGNCGASFHWAGANFCYSCGAQMTNPTD